MWNNVDKFKEMRDITSGAVSHQVVTAFMTITEKCVMTNHKKRCSMDSVSIRELVYTKSN